MIIHTMNYINSPRRLGYCRKCNFSITESERNHLEKLIYKHLAANAQFLTHFSPVPHFYAP